MAFFGAGGPYITLSLYWPLISSARDCGSEISMPESSEYTAPSRKMLVFKTESVRCLLLVMRAESRKSLEMEIKCAHPPDGGWYLLQENTEEEDTALKSLMRHWNPAGPVPSLHAPFSLLFRTPSPFPSSCFPFPSTFLLSSLSTQNCGPHPQD